MMLRFTAERKRHLKAGKRVKITIVCVGKIKESFYRDAVAEYRKRLGKYCRLEIVEVADEKTPDGAGEALENSIKEKEAKRILDILPSNKTHSYAQGAGASGKGCGNTVVCTLEIAGKRLSSEGMARWMERLTVGGTSHIVFVIGGSLGLHESVLKLSDMPLSFSDMTFPHQLMRVILLEQIYRSFRIINGEPYHK